MQEDIQKKRFSGETLPPEDFEEFCKERESLFDNPIASDFLEAQQEMAQVQQSVMQYVTKTFEVGHVPSEEDLRSCPGSCSGCGGP